MVSDAYHWIWCVATCRPAPRVKMRGALGAEGWRDLKVRLEERRWTYAAKKISDVEVLWRPYRKPTLVDRGKSPKAFEITIVKELGKLTP